MSFLGSLGDFVSNGLPAATNVLAAHKQADANAAQQQQNMLMQRYALDRQAREDDVKRALLQAQTSQANSRANALANPATKYTYKVGADGSLYALPTSSAAGAAPDQSVKPISTGVKAPVPAQKPASTIPGTPEWAQAQEAAAKIKAKYRPPPTPNNVFVTGIDPTTQQPTIFAGKSKGDPTLTPTGIAKPAAGADNANNKLTNARARAAIGEMNNANSFMNDYEDRLAAGKANISGVDQYLSTVGNDFVDNHNPAKQTAALAVLNQKNPDAARYIRRALSFAEGESGISTRPSDFRTRMAAFLSAASTGASPEIIGDIRSRRQSILSQLNQVYPEVQGGDQSRAGRGGAPSVGSSPAPSADLAKRQKLWDDAVAKHGVDKVVREVGPRPQS